MGLGEKLKFWKKEEEPLEGFGALDDKGAAPFPGDAPGQLPPEPNFQEPGQMPPEGGPALPPMGEDTGLPPELRGVAQQPPTQVHQAPQQAAPINQMEVISAKLDAIKVSLENVNIRLERIERLAHGQEQQHDWYKQQ